ncbi:LysE family translocator [Streptomyces sp. S6]
MTTLRRLSRRPPPFNHPLPLPPCPDTDHPHRIRRRRYGTASVLGNEAGVLIWGLATAFGLSALLPASRLTYDVIRFTGAIVLVRMGARTLWQARRVSRTAEPPADTTPPSLRHAFRQGLVTNVANPKAGVFAIAFLPPYTPLVWPTTRPPTTTRNNSATPS